MRPQQIMFLALIFTAGTLLSLTLGGLWIGEEEVETVNALAVIREVNFFGLLTISVPNAAFWSTGVVKLIQFDFAFFVGGTEILRYILIMVLSTGAVFGFFVIIIVVATNLLRR